MDTNKESWGKGVREGGGSAVMPEVEVPLKRVSQKHKAKQALNYAKDLRAAF